MTAGLTSSFEDVSRLNVARYIAGEFIQPAELYERRDWIDISFIYSRLILMDWLVIKVITHFKYDDAFPLPQVRIAMAIIIRKCDKLCVYEKLYNVLFLVILLLWATYIFAKLTTREK